MLFPGQNVWPETSWMTWGTMTSWCCACWKEATSSVPTWWTGSKHLAATPTAQSPWGSTSFGSKATWWAPAHCCTDRLTEAIISRDGCFMWPTWSITMMIKFSVFFLFPQNDQSTEDLHIVGAEDLSFLAGKVIFLSSTTASSPTFNKEQHLCPAERHSKL